MKINMGESGIYSVEAATVGLKHSAVDIPTSTCIIMRHFWQLFSF